MPSPPPNRTPSPPPRHQQKTTEKPLFHMKTRARPTHPAVECRPQREPAPHTPRTTADPNAMLTQTFSPNAWSTPRIAICTRHFPNNCNWRLLSACASVWTESFKICKSWALINHVLPQCFRSHWLWLNKSNHRVK